MYRIGSKVSYPYYGVGKIEDIVTRNFRGEKGEYYVISFPEDSLKLMVPVGKAKEVGLRKVIPSKRVGEVLDALKERAGEPPKNIKTITHAHCLEKLESPNVLQVAEITSDLLYKKEERRLSWAQRELLKRGLHILGDEIAQAKHIKKTRARKLILESWREGLTKKKAS